MGHSFIRRLAGFLQNRGHKHLMAKLSPLRHISFHGVGGRTIAKVRKFDLSIIRLSPDINPLTPVPPETARAKNSSISLCRP